MLIKKNKTFALAIIFVISYFITVNVTFAYKNEPTNIQQEISYHQEWLEQIIGLTNRTTLSTQTLEDDILLVLLQTDNNMSGYSVLQKIDDSYQLIEFGSGSVIPYTTDMIADEKLRQSNQSMRINYYSPLENFWQTTLQDETAYIEGTTGEWLPEIDKKKPSLNQLSKESLSEHKIKDAFLDYSLNFDPLNTLPWNQSNVDSEVTSTLSKIEVKEQINSSEQLIYKGSKYDGLVDFAYPVIGYSEIGNTLYLALYHNETELTQYVPYDVLVSYGYFKQN